MHSPSPILLDRRNALRAGAGVLAAALTPWARGAAAPSGGRPLLKISLAQWSLHRTLFAGELDHLDFAAAAKRDYDIDAVEYVNQFFKDKATDAAYLAQMQRRAADAGSTSLLIMVDGEGALGAPDARVRAQAVENHVKWLDAARRLGCHSIRVNAQSAGDFDEQMKLAADGLRRLTERGAEREVNVLVENHGGLSSHGGWLVGVIRRVDHPRCGVLPDFGNFDLGNGKTYDRYQGVREMMPYAKAVSAKSMRFDDAGAERDIDYRRMLQIVLSAGYRGHVGIEYSGTDLSEPAGIRATKALLERVWAALAEQA